MLIVIIRHLCPFEQIYYPKQEIKYDMYCGVSPVHKGITKKYNELVKCHLLPIIALILQQSKMYTSWFCHFHKWTKLSDKKMTNGTTDMEKRSHYAGGHNRPVQNSENKKGNTKGCQTI
jgi:hypothetical protein